MTVNCVICKKPINPHDISSWKEVTGFVGGPKKDSMVLRRDTGYHACTPCINKEKQGQAPDQVSLFTEVAPVHTTPEALDKFLGETDAK